MTLARWHIQQALGALWVGFGGVLTVQAYHELVGDGVVLTTFNLGGALLVGCILFGCQRIPDGVQ